MLIFSYDKKRKCVDTLIIRSAKYQSSLLNKETKLSTYRAQLLPNKMHKKWEQLKGSRRNINVLLRSRLPTGRTLLWFCRIHYGELSPATSGPFRHVYQGRFPLSPGESLIPNRLLLSVSLFCFSSIGRAPIEQWTRTACRGEPKFCRCKIWPLPRR